MRIKLEKRPEPSRLMVVLTPIASVILTMLVGVVVFDLIGIDGQRAVVDGHACLLWTCAVNTESKHRCDRTVKHMC